MSHAGTFYLVKFGAPYLKTNKNGGSILLVSSIAGYHPGYGSGVYCVSKTALLGMTRVLSNKLGPQNIRANCLCPGYFVFFFFLFFFCLGMPKKIFEIEVVLTKMTDCAMSHEFVKSKVINETPLKVRNP